MKLASKFVSALCLVACLSAAASAQDAAPAVTDDPKTWPADVKTAYDEICALPAESRDAAKSAIFALAGKGRLARPAIAAIAKQADLPEPHRAFGGILLAHFARFAPAELRTLAENPNPFAQRESITMLGELGGKENSDFLADLAQRTASEGLKKHIAKVTASFPAKPLSPEALVLLDRVVNADAESKKRAAVVLSEEFGKPAAEALLKIVKDLVSDDDARTFAALAIVHINAGSVADLESLCARTNHKTLRYCAVKELAGKGAEGEAVLRKLAADPTEPLKKQIDALLTPPEK